jgi:hypothetical protein
VLASRACSGDLEDSAKVWASEDNEGEVAPFWLRVPVSTGAWFERYSLAGE